MRNRQVLIIPVTFGFGPASHAVTIAETLRGMDPEIVLTGSGDGAAVELMLGSDMFDAVIETEAGRLSSSFNADNYAAAVVVGDFERAGHLAGLSERTVFVDALYWMWPEDPLPQVAAAAYLCLEFPGVRARLEQSIHSVEVARQVNQILEPGPPVLSESERDRLVMVNLGGAVSPFGTNYDYLSVLVRIISDAVQEVCRDSEVVITCSTHAAMELQARAADDQYGSFSFTTPRGMQSMLQRAELLITLPGMSIVWEALHTEVPTLLLPAANYSQHRQTAAYREYLACEIVEWTALEGYEEVAGGLPEEDGSAHAADLLARFVEDEAARRTLREILQAKLERGVGPVRALEGGPYWQAFGGAEDVAHEVLRVMASRLVRDERLS